MTQQEYDDAKELESTETAPPSYTQIWAFLNGKRCVVDGLNGVFLHLQDVVQEGDNARRALKVERLLFISGAKVRQFDTKHIVEIADQLGFDWKKEFPEFFDGWNPSLMWNAREGYYN